MESVNIGTLKAHLSEYIRKARQGNLFVVFDRQSPVACIVPYEQNSQALISRKPLAKLGDFPIPKKPACTKSSLDALLEERQLNR
jgi:antitoxin (DNA-binding transcriptional repressor) of toxin-antitoxin stability system